MQQKKTGLQGRIGQSDFYSESYRWAASTADLTNMRVQFCLAHDGTTAHCTSKARHECRQDTTAVESDHSQQLNTIFSRNHFTSIQPYRTEEARCEFSPPFFFFYKSMRGKQGQAKHAHDWLPTKMLQTVTTFPGCSNSLLKQFRKEGYRSLTRPVSPGTTIHRARGVGTANIAK